MRFKKAWKLSAAEVAKNRKRFLARISLYRRHGYDRVTSNEFIVRQAGSLKGSILEIGTGKGHLTTLLARQARGLVTVDISAKDQRLAALNLASAGLLDKVTFVTGDAANLPYANGSFDLVISANAFHHFEYPFAVLQEMMRLCRRKLVIADFNREGFAIVRRIHRAEGREHEEKSGDFDIVGAYLKEYGFSVRRSEDHCQAVYVARPKRLRRDKK